MKALIPSQLEKKEFVEFASSLNDQIRRGEKVFLATGHKIWFQCGFVTPFPKTIGYKFYAPLEAIEEAVRIESPDSFYVGGYDHHGYEFKSYRKVDSVEMVKSDVRFYAAKYKLNR